MNGHLYPELFEPETEEEMMEAEADFRRQQEEEREDEITAQLYATPYNPPRLTLKQRAGTMTDEEWQSYLADCDSYENIQEP